MKISRQYNLQFSKSYTTGKGLTHSAKVAEGSTDLAHFLTLSNLEETLSEIAEVPDSGDVKIGDTVLPNNDFKAILQEWLEHIQPISIETEVRKLRLYTRLPITYVIFDDRHQLGEPYLDEENYRHIKTRAKLYINEQHIGEIEYSSAGTGHMYDTNSLPELVNWAMIAEMFYAEIFAEIFKKEPLAASFDLDGHENLSIKNADGNVIKLGFCHYLDDRWRVGVFGLNAQQMTKTVTVKLTPPQIDF